MIVSVCENGCNDDVSDIIIRVHKEWIKHVGLTGSLRIVVRVGVVVCRVFVIS